MNHVKTKNRKRVVRPIVFALTIILTLSTGLFTTAFAISDGENISYTSHSIDGGATIFDVDGHMGFCIEPETEAASSGRGTADQLSGSAGLAKVCYYISQKGWDQNLEDRDPNTGSRWATVCTAMTQISGPNRAAALSYWRDEHGQEWLDKILAYVDAAQNVSVPRSFKVFTVDAGSYQDFGVFYLEPTGYLKIKKVSSNTGITG